MKIRKGNFITFILYLLFAAVAGFQFGKFFYSNPDDIEFSKIADAYKYLNKYYYKEVSDSSLAVDAIEGMFKNLDPHTTYISPEEQKSLMEQFEGNFEGIGIEFQIIEDTITVISPITGGPSEKLGILSGDKIIEIDTLNAVGFKNSDVIKNLRGAKGEPVDITVYRESINDTIHFHIIRDMISIHSVDAAFMTDGGTAYIRLSRFAETSSDEILSALDSLQSEGMKALIFDLRGNPGGLLDQAVAVSDIFLPKGKLVVYTKGRIKSSNEEFYTVKNYGYEKIPLAILINRGSASASEIVSGAVQDWGRAEIFGEVSFGKGLVQRPFLLADNSAVRITISSYFTPKGRIIQRDYSDRERYYSEALERDSVSVIKGGIHPDSLIIESALSPLMMKLASKNLFYKFIFSELKGGAALLKPYDKLENFADAEVIDESTFMSFYKYCRKYYPLIKPNEFGKNRNEISARLKANLARLKWNNIGWYGILLKYDKIFKAAEEYLHDKNREKF